MLSIAERSRSGPYWRAATLWRELDRLLDVNDIRLLRDILAVGWLGPLSDDDLFEVYVLVRVLKVLEEWLCESDPKRYQYNLMSIDRYALASFEGLEWSANVYFDTAPHRAFGPIFSGSDYKYLNLLARYGDSAAAARRPDICIMLKRKADEFVIPLLLEVKNTSFGVQYGRDSVYKSLGYLADFERLWPNERVGVRPKALLVLRDGVNPDDYAAALAEDLVIISPPNLVKRLLDCLDAALKSVPASSFA
jgi:hypothetical protein